MYKHFTSLQISVFIIYVQIMGISKRILLLLCVIGAIF